MLAAAAPPASASVSLPDVSEPAMVAEVNRERAARGLHPMHYSGSLRRSAAGYARWMLRAGYFGHLARIRASGRYRRVGEVLELHRGSRTQIRRTVRRWLDSPSHRHLLLSRGFRHLGAGRERGSFRGRPSTAWVLHFGA